jgi:hypothetical protein
MIPEKQSFNALRNLCFWGDNILFFSGAHSFEGSYSHFSIILRQSNMAGGKSPIYFDHFPIETPPFGGTSQLVMFDYPKQLVNPSIWRFPSFHGILKSSSRHECMTTSTETHDLTLLLSPINSIHVQAFTTWVTAGQGVHPSSATHLAKGLAELRVWIDAWNRWRPSGHLWEHLPSGYLTL